MNPAWITSKHVDIGYPYKRMLGTKDARTHMNCFAFNTIHWRAISPKQNYFKIAERESLDWNLKCNTYNRNQIGKERVNGFQESRVILGVMINTCTIVMAVSLLCSWNSVLYSVTPTVFSFLQLHCLMLLDSLVTWATTCLKLCNPYNILISKLSHMMQLFIEKLFNLLDPWNAPSENWTIQIFLVSSLKFSQPCWEEIT